MDDRDIKKLYDAVLSIKYKLEKISERLGFIEHIIRQHIIRHIIEENMFMVRFHKGSDIGSINETLRQHKENILTLKETLRENEIPTQETAIYFTMLNARNTGRALDAIYELGSKTDFITSKGLLGICAKCGGQLQLLVEDDTINLTCSKCGRWMWQGVKHI